MHKEQKSMLWIIIVLALAVSAQSQQTTTGSNAPAQPARPESGTFPLMEQRALDRLKQMSDALKGANAFTFHSHSMVEVPAKTGQFVTLFGDSDVALQRPNKLRAHVTGEVPAFDLYYDGTKLIAYAPQNNVYSMTNAPDNIDATLRFLEEKVGIHIPSADILYSDPYAALTKDLNSAFVVGTGTVDGVQCEHMAFRNPGINWEIWIETGGSSLPRRLTATYADVQNFPRFLVEFSNWNLHPNLPANTFEFNPPANAKQIEFRSPMGQKAQ
jgi:hypothetical protein